MSALLVTVCFSLPFALFISRPASLLHLMQVIASHWIWTRLAPIPTPPDSLLTLAQVIASHWIWTRLAPFWYFMTGPEFFTS